MSSASRLSFTADWQQIPPVSVGVPSRPKTQKSAFLLRSRSHSRLIENLRIGTKLQEIGREWVRLHAPQKVRAFTADNT